MVIDRRKKIVPPNAKNRRRMIFLQDVTESDGLQHRRVVSIYQYLWKIKIKRNVKLITTMMYSLTANAQAGTNTHE